MDSEQPRGRLMKGYHFREQDDRADRLDLDRLDQDQDRLNRLDRSDSFDRQGLLDYHRQRPRRPAPLVTTLKTLSLLLTGSLATVGLILLLGVWRSGTQFLTDALGLFQPHSTTRVDVRSMVVQQVRGVSQLTTAVFAMETVVPTSRERSINGLVIGKTTLLYIAYGEVRAGVDLSSLGTSDIQVIGDSIQVRLPPPKILDSKIDVNRSKVYDYDRGFLGLGPDAAPELQELAQRQTLERLVDAACTGGLLETANDRAKLAVTQLLTTAGYRQVIVETQPPFADACTAVPAIEPSSQPQTLESDSPPAL